MVCVVLPVKFFCAVSFYFRSYKNEKDEKKKAQAANTRKAETTLKLCSIACTRVTPPPPQEEQNTGKFIIKKKRKNPLGLVEAIEEAIPLSD